MESAAGPQLLAVCFSKGGEFKEACAGGGASVAVGGMGVSTATGFVAVTGAVGLAGFFVLVGFGIAVGTAPTGWITFLKYVFATS
jgi:hypothetical protein